MHIGKMDAYAIKLLRKELGIVEPFKSVEEGIAAINSLGKPFTEWLEEKIKNELMNP